jgi:predicted ATPase
MDLALKSQEQACVLPTLEITGFRAFQRLVFAHLGRVNLIVGKNNVGKSSVLEAIRLYADGGSSSTIGDLLEQRDLLDYRVLHKSDVHTDRLEVAVEQLFHREADLFAKRATIGPKSGGPMLTIERVMLDADEILPVQQQSMFGDDIFSPGAEPGIRVRLGETRVINVPLARFDAFTRWRGWTEVAPVVFIGPDGEPDSDLGKLWDNVALTELESSVLDAMRVIEPDLERLSFVGESEGYERFPVVKIRGYSRPLPLRTLGDGMNRLLTIALALVNSQNGILLIDEVENGIHYSVQVRMWELIFRVATQLNVQVFVTTHSWDCIEAFQQVANARPDVEGMLHRLERRGDGAIGVVDISEEDLAIVARQKIEVR